MRHATQARFDRVARGELQRPAYTIEQMERWTETDWNWHVRQALQAQGYNTFHIREASETGVADLIVYKTRTVQVYVSQDSGSTAMAEMDTQTIECWMELKKDNSKADNNFQAGQKAFMKSHWEVARNALFVMFDRQVGMLAIHQGDLRGRVKMLPAYPYGVDWAAVFAHFKARR